MGKSKFYSGTVWEQFHPYLRPHETGNKTDVQWISLYNEKGVGLIAVGDSLLSVSAYQFHNEDLDYIPGVNRHSNEIRPKDLVTLNIDHKQMGVGGDTSCGWRAMPLFAAGEEIQLFILFAPFFEKRWRVFKNWKNKLLDSRIYSFLTIFSGSKFSGQFHPEIISEGFSISNDSSRSLKLICTFLFSPGSKEK